MFYNFHINVAYRIAFVTVVLLHQIHKNFEIIMIELTTADLI